MGLHVGDDPARSLPSIEIARIALDPLQHGGQLRLHQDVARLICLSAALKDAPALRKTLHPLDRLFHRETPRQILADDESFRSQLPRRLDEIRPWQLAVTFVRECETGNGARHGDGFVADERSILDHVAFRIEVHVATGRQRRDLAVIDRLCRPVRFADQHESAAAEVSGLGPRDGERQRDRHRRVDRVAPALHHVRSDPRGNRVDRSHHRMRLAHGKA